MNGRIRTRLIVFTWSFRLRTRSPFESGAETERPSNHGDYA